MSYHPSAINILLTLLLVTEKDAAHQGVSDSSTFAVTQTQNATDRSLMAPVLNLSYKAKKPPE